MITPTYTTELELLREYRLIGGVDEVGRGPLAGPVVSAVVILKPDKVGKYRSKTKWWRQVRDSKTLSPRKRGSLIDFIREYAYDFGIGLVDNEEIDDLNIHNATLLSMKRAVENLKELPEVLLVDGRFKVPFDSAPSASSSGPRGQGKIVQKTIVDGDASILSIACASILAKVYRDDLMRKLAKKYTSFGFERHKGYSTLFHRKRLLEFGACEIHRFSFPAVKKIMSQRFQQSLFHLE